MVGVKLGDGSDMIFSPTKRKILLFSYAFPPLQLPMSPAVFKPMAAVARLGYQVDVLCADSFSPYIPLDNSLLPYVEKTFPQVLRLKPPNGLIGKLHCLRKPSDTTNLAGALKNLVPNPMYVLQHFIPDLMAVLHRSAYEYLMNIDLSCYDAVVTWSPFHSVNPVMVQVKKHKKVNWIAQFSDPWSGNPLEGNIFRKLWHQRNEADMVKSADFIIHSSRYSMDLMLRRYQKDINIKAAVLPHAFDKELYPIRSKANNAQVIMRYVGVLFGRRSPEPLFRALNMLFKRRRDLKFALKVELVGAVPVEMLNTSAALSLPKGTVTNIPNVTYIESLELMYDADILLLIDADINQNLFLPSKLADYIGADTPIVGLVPSGASEDAIKELGGWYARPSDTNNISNVIERAVDYVMTRPQLSWCNSAYRETISGKEVGSRLINIIRGLDGA